MVSEQCRGNLAVVQSLLERQPELVNWCQSDGATPLMEAAIVGQVQLVKYLVQKGATLNQQDKKNGWSALMQAVYHEHMDIVQYLLVAGASVDLMAFDGYTALDLAWLLEKPNVAQFLLEWKEKVSISSCSGKLLEFSLHKPSSMKSSLRWKQSRNNSFKTLLGQVATRFQQFKSPRTSTSSSPGGIDETLFCLGNTNKASPVTMLKLSSFHLKKKEESDQSKPWDMPVNPPLLPSEETSAAFSCHLPPRCKAPKEEFHPVHLLRQYRKLQDIQSIKSNFAGNHVHSFESPIIQKEAKYVVPATSMKTAALRCGKFSGDSVDSLLKELSLDRYTEKIKHHEIDLDTFTTLTEEDLEEIGISYGPREQLLSAISVLKNKIQDQ